MLNVVWGILNILIVIYALVICFKTIKLIRNKLGIIATIVFILMIISYLNIEKNNFNVKTFDINKPNIKMNGCKSISIVLEKNMISKSNLYIVFGKQKDIIIPLKANSTLEGFTSGIKWSPSSILVSKIDSTQKFKYEVCGINSWNIIGIEIYSQEKKYFGVIDKVDLKNN